MPGFWASCARILGIVDPPFGMIFARNRLAAFGLVLALAGLLMSSVQRRQQGRPRLVAYLVVGRRWLSDTFWVFLKGAMRCEDTNTGLRPIIQSVGSTLRRILNRIWLNSICCRLKTGNRLESVRACLLSMVVAIQAIFG